MYETCHFKIQDLLFVTCTVQHVVKSTLIIPKTNRNDENLRSNKKKLIKYVVKNTWKDHFPENFIWTEVTQQVTVWYFWYSLVKCYKVLQRLPVLSLFIRFHTWTRFPMNLHFLIFFPPAQWLTGYWRFFALSCWQAESALRRSEVTFSVCVCALAMAATGGGKIRTRRYHIVSKPYAKGKQVIKSALVLDTVQLFRVDLKPGVFLCVFTAETFCGLQLFLFAAWAARIISEVVYR